VWSAETQAGVLAAPISYEVDGEQYIAVEVGWGGAFGLAAGKLACSHVASNLPRMLVYKLGGNANLPPLPAAAPAVLNPPPETAPSATVTAGKKLYHTFCSTCHGDSATGSGVLPDLRYSPAINNAKAMDVIVRQGSLQSSGMIAFKYEVSAQDLEAIRAYVIHRANEDKRNPAEYQNPPH
jgi:quinohemoprotein ethanol dehydrogenase